ncbi:hypothetical protein [Amycolatopsis sp. 195334CR]|uniref:hypothetical protein n=1 Tax=Amycolatopsis sp. 195334CR TaxID=2814588 RepID=UPI001A8C1892|nr:hypothetical protein [Amycolatopsis sp. 195334CR]MBN6036030.1 hypothetical protein [Amycolatopsis sp. 195334CR]
MKDGKVGALGAVVAVVVDSRNVYHQSGDAIGLRALPTVPGIRAALVPYGFDVAAVHVGLALARPRDRVSLARFHADNDAYRKSVITDGGDPLLGELHVKAAGRPEEKMVDCACCVRITRYVEEIAAGKSAVEGIVVLSKDIDLTPAVNYAMERKVPITVAAVDVVQHRGHPYALLSPAAYATMSGDARLTTGHEYRQLLACALFDGKAVNWTVGGSRSHPRLEHHSGIVGIPESSTALPGRGQVASLYPVDIAWEERVLGSFPALICGNAPQTQPTWSTAIVVKRSGPLAIEIDHGGGAHKRVPFMLGGVRPGDTVVVHRGADGVDRVVGQLLKGNATFDPDVVEPLRVTSPLPRGGALVAAGSGVRGLLTTNQSLVAGQRVPGIQVDLKPKGPVWAAVGTPLP